MSSQIYWVEGNWPGRLGILPRPRGADWLDLEVQAWKNMSLQTVVSLLMPEEISQLDLENEPQACQSRAIEFINFGIPDRGIPGSREEAVKVLHRLHESLSAGRRVGVHCRQGIGRSGLVAAGLLILGGVAPEAAVASVSHTRGWEVPETAQQRAWLNEFAALLRHAQI